MDSIIVPGPSYRIGATIDVSLAVSSRELLAEDKAIIPSSQLGPPLNIGNGDPVFQYDPQMMRNLPVQVTTRPFGKALALANTAHLPHGLSRADIAQLRAFGYNDDEIQEVKRQGLRRGLVFLGISQGTYIHEGPDKSPAQDGIAVIIGGQSTMATYFESVPPIFADITFGLLSEGPISSTGARQVSKTNSQKVPITFRAVHPRGTIDIMTRTVRSYAAKLHPETGNPRTRLPCDMNVQNDSIASAALEDEKNAALLTYGLMTMLSEMLQSLAADGHITINNGKSATQMQELLGVKAAQNQDKAGVEASKKLVSKLLVQCVGAAVGSPGGSGGATTGAPSAAVPSKRGKAGFMAFAGALKDIDNQYGRAVGKLVGIQPSKQGRSETGWRTADIRMY